MRKTTHKDKKNLDLTVVLLYCVVCRDETKTAHHTPKYFQPDSGLWTREISQNLLRLENKQDFFCIANLEQRTYKGNNIYITLNTIINKKTITSKKKKAIRKLHFRKKV